MIGFSTDVIEDDIPYEELTTTLTLEFRTIPVANITPSPSNPRKRINEAALKELTESVRLHGVLEPIMVRPIEGYRITEESDSDFIYSWSVVNKSDLTLSTHNNLEEATATLNRLNAEYGKYELVFGERRWRAATAAGIEAMPAIIRNLNDREVLEIQVIENLQREDVHPLEEAEGYERLMHQYGVAAEDMAAKVGKGKTYIYTRIKLLALCPAARDAFYAGKLNTSTALLIARIPNGDLQAKALADITFANEKDVEPMTYREAQDHIQKHYMLRLEDAIFDTTSEKLVPEAGSCTKCLKRTGNQIDLFSDVSSADVCIDPPCFASKKSAHWEIVKVTAEKKGIRIIEGNEAKKIKPHSFLNRLDSEEFVQLDTPLPNDDEGRTPREILGKKIKADAILQDPQSGAAIELISVDRVETKIKSENAQEPNAMNFGDGDTLEAEEKRIEQENLLTRIPKEMQFRAKLLLAINEAMDGVLSRQAYNLVLLEQLVHFDFYQANALQEIADRIGCLPSLLENIYEEENQQLLLERITALTDRQFIDVILYLTVCGELMVFEHTLDKVPPYLTTLAQLYQIDTALLRDETLPEPVDEPPSNSKRRSRPKKIKPNAIEVTE